MTGPGDPEVTRYQALQAAANMVFGSALTDLADAHRAAGYAAGYAEAVKHIANEITASTGHAAGTPEEVIRWLVRTWDAPKQGFCRACETRDGCIKRGCKISGDTP